MLSFAFISALMIARLLLANSGVFSPPAAGSIIARVLFWSSRLTYTRFWLSSVSTRSYFFLPLLIPALPANLKDRYSALWYVLPSIESQ